MPIVLSLLSSLYKGVIVIAVLKGSGGIMTLQVLADLATIGQFILAVVVALGGGVLLVGYLRKMKPVWKRFADNVSREVAVISTENQSMSHEAELLKKVGLFKIKSVAADVRSLDLIRHSSLLVVGYSPDSDVYREILNYAKVHQLPIIVFAGRNRLSAQDRDGLKNYSYSSLCETELRLVSDVFAVMSTFPGAEE
jgi:hypothetical protein